MNELAKRAVACKHWRFMRGMTLLDGGLVTGERDGVPIVYAHAGRHSADMLCDLTDPATLGCLLALVRKAWNDDKIGLRWVEDDFGNDVCHIVRQRYGDWEMRTTIASSVIEAAALVNALEAAP